MSMEIKTLFFWVKANCILKFLKSKHRNSPSSRVPRGRKRQNCQEAPAISSGTWCKLLLEILRTEESRRKQDTDPDVHLSPPRYAAHAHKIVPAGAAVLQAVTWPPRCAAARSDGVSPVGCSVLADALLQPSRLPDSGRLVSGFPLCAILQMAQK